jgi:hypothetical protein
MSVMTDMRELWCACCSYGAHIPRWWAPCCCQTCWRSPRIPPMEREAKGATERLEVLRVRQPSTWL